MKRCMYQILFLICLSVTNMRGLAQDSFSGTWSMQYSLAEGRPPMTVTLQVAPGERNILYPAQLIINDVDFKARYQFLLVRKDSRQIAIGAQKFAVSESPFSLGNRTMTLNGCFDLSRDYRENAQYLTAIRISSKQAGIALSDNKQVDPAYRTLADQLFRFFSEGEIRFKKSDNIPWSDPGASLLLDPSSSPAYLGIKDTVKLNRKDGIITYPRTRKMDNDTISLALNGKLFADQVALNKKKEADDILLDTGVNILVVFADNFGKTPPNQGKVELDFGYKKWMIDFNQPEDQGGGFIVSRIVYDNEEENNSRFAAYFDAMPVQKINERTTKLLGSLVSNSNEITLALWDDAVEDGDTISLNVNGNWIAKDFPVLKRPQFIKVTIKPGANSIVFVANNLGSIPPNTAVLEIIDGKKRKSFMIDTDLEKNNLVRIFYDFKPGD